MFPGKVLSFSFILTQRPTNQEGKHTEDRAGQPPSKSSRAMLLPLRIRMPELEHLNPAPPKPPTKQFTGQETPQNDIPNHSMAF
jgi:hypothetical protein